MLRAPFAFAFAAALTFAAVVTGCRPDGGDTSDERPLPYDVPSYFPRPLLPDDNFPTVEKIELGRVLFADKRLSENQTQACASCHLADKGFADGKATPLGSTGDVVPRNAMALGNVAWASTLTWANPVLETLEAQALVPLFADHPNPIELGIATSVDEVEGRLRADAAMVELFAAAFGDAEDAITIDNAVKAIASYERSLVSGDTAYDRYFNGGDSEALTDLEKQGLQLFFSERTECYHCHGGAFFTSSTTSEASVVTESGYENNGLYDVDAEGVASVHLGLANLTGAPRDRGRFKVPTLRNIALTGPYMHDGSLRTLEDVVAHYAKGGSGSERQNDLVHELDLTADEQRALVAFLRALTDDAFVAAHLDDAPTP
jgi:cytochrome c peroxidase